MQVEQKMQECIDTLVEIKESGYWPYASPAPSSSEVKIKEGIDKAISGLENALYWHRQVFSKQNKDKSIMKTYYQPVRYYDDGTYIAWGDIPKELYSFQAFGSREDCENWLENNGYNSGDYDIWEYHDDDIEDVAIIDKYGNPIE